MHPIIIIGAGLAGWTTVREFRKLDTTTPVMVISLDDGVFYAKPSLSNALAQGRTPAQLVSTPALTMVQTLGVTLLARTRVQAIDPARRTIVTSQGEFTYSQLVLATGAQPIRVPLAGDAADQVQSVNSLDDFAAFHTLLTGAGSHDKARVSVPADLSRKHVLIMGAGLIGCEFANDLAAAGYLVTVVDPSSGPVAALLPAQASAQLQQALAALGVTWHFGATVTSVDRVPGGDAVRHRPVLQVMLSNGELVLVDRVLSAIGLRADTALAQAAGLVCERGIVVDAILQSSRAQIYALGDAAQYASGRWLDRGIASNAGSAPVSGGRTMPFVMPLMSAARALAATLAGTPTEVVFPLMPVAIKTPALPIVVAAPAPATPGGWHNPEPGLWRFIDVQGRALGFVLAGKQTSRRAEQAKLLAA